MPDLAQLSDADLQDFDRMVILSAAALSRVPRFVADMEGEVLRELHRRGWIEIVEGSVDDFANAHLRRLYPDGLGSEIH